MLKQLPICTILAYDAYIIDETALFTLLKSPQMGVRIWADRCIYGNFRALNPRSPFAMKHVNSLDIVQQLSSELYISKQVIFNESRMFAHSGDLETTIYASNF